MNYLDTLETELKATGIPARRRARILTEFADHLHEDAERPARCSSRPGAPVRRRAGHPARSRASAFRVFAALAFAGASLVGDVPRRRPHARPHAVQASNHTPTPGWAAPILMFAMLAGQVALAAGGTAVLRAWRLRRPARDQCPGGHGARPARGCRAWPPVPWRCSHSPPSRSPSPDRRAQPGPPAPGSSPVWRSAHSSRPCPPCGPRSGFDPRLMDEAGDLVRRSGSSGTGRTHADLDRRAGRSGDRDRARPGRMWSLTIPTTASPAASSTPLPA